MRKAFAAAGAALLLAGCGNMAVVDTTWNFKYAKIAMSDGSVIEGPVELWKDYENSDAVMVKINGVWHYTHLANVDLMDKRP